MVRLWHAATIVLLWVALVLASASQLVEGLLELASLKAHLYASLICPKVTRKGAHMPSNAYISNGQKYRRMLKKTKLKVEHKGQGRPDSDSDSQSPSHSIAPGLIPAQASPTPTSPGTRSPLTDIPNSIPDKVNGGDTVVYRDSKRPLYVDRCVRD